MENGTFIGTGINPEGPDLPLGFGMQLAQDPKAMEMYGKLTNAQRSDLINFVQGGATGDDAKQRITQAVRMLHDG